MSVTISNRCPGCFQATDPNPVCPSCGTNRRERRPKNVLPLWATLLGGRYILGVVLGKGGFGVTYAAWDDVMRQRIAVKELFPANEVVRASDGLTVEPQDSGKTESFDYHRRTFLEEARMLARFKHEPGIVLVEDHFEENNTAYLSMEYLEGRTLERYLDDHKGRLSHEEAWRIMRPVLETLGKVHERKTPDRAQMIHRDIKPENIFITNNGRILLLDFGTARFAGGTIDRTLTAVGTEDFAPLEQHTHKNQGPWTDIYAAAATWYRAVTGKTPTAAIRRMDSDALQPPSKRGIRLPKGVEEAWLKALALQPADRWTDTTSMIQALDRLLHRQPVEPEARPAGTRAVTEAPAPEPGPPVMPLLRALGGEMKGHDFPLGEGPVTLGRDPSTCQIIFTDRVVSRRHCTVLYNTTQGIFTVTDQGSTSGTYLADGKPVVAHTAQPLQSGDRFYMSRPEILFEVTMVSGTY